MKNGLLFGLASLLLYGCGREEVQTYKVPKEPASAAVSHPPAQQAPSAPTKPAGKGFTAALPDGWAEQAGKGMRIVSYTIDGTSIDFYLISLSMGDVPSNVNRWRGQVGLAPATPGDINAELASFQAGGHDVKYIEIYNEDEGKGILAAIIDLNPQYWYFTAKGSVEELKANTADIRTFLESITFEGHNH